MKARKSKKYKPITFRESLRRELKDPEFRRYYEEEGVKMAIAFKIIELRKKSGMTQSELAKKIGTTQSQVARMESSNTSNYEVKTLQKIAAAAGKQLQIKFI
jgi:DNA-binding XRE family transcriptional regulator